MAKTYQKGEESSKEPSARQRLVSLFPSYLFLIKENKSSFSLFVSKVATSLSGTNSSAWTLVFPITPMAKLCFYISIHQDNILGMTEQVHPLRLWLFSIGPRPFVQMHAQIILSIILVCQSHLRFPKLCSHHPPTFMPIIKASFVHTPPSCWCSAQYPVQGLEMLLFWHLPFKCIQKGIYLI